MIYLENYRYFIRAIVDTLESDVYMAIHPDDPPWDILAGQESLGA